MTKLNINWIMLPGLFFLSACSFNKMYLQPTKVPDGARKLTLSTPGDTTYVQFSDNNYQPVFLKDKKDTIEFEFTIESLVFESASGNRLNGWMMKSKDVPPNVTLLHLHGNAGFLMSQYQALTPLLKYGFQVFVFDYSGFGFSTGKATRKNVLADANSALDYVKSRPDVMDRKLIIYGQSLGGHLSAVVAAARQADIDGLVIEGAFSSHKDVAANRAGFAGRILVSEKYSAVESIRDYKKPLLVIHSTEDEVIPFKMGKKIFDQANEPKVFYEIKKRHICGPEYYADSISVKITDMLNVK